MSDFVCTACGGDSLCREENEYVCKCCGSRYDADGNPVSVMPDDFIELVNRASEYEAQHKSVREIYSLMEALEIVPGNAAVQVRIGRAYRDSNLLDKALKYYQSATESDPKYPQGYINTGVVLTARLRFEEACEYFEKAMELLTEDDQDYATVLANYSFAEAKAGNREKALELLCRADENGYQECETIRKLFGFTLEEMYRYKK